MSDVRLRSFLRQIARDPDTGRLSGTAIICFGLIALICAAAIVQTALMIAPAYH